jgi:prepilin-type N-terminal cleavage/methylation domain-containing protein
MRSPIRRPGGPRRGVTLVEMLVVVALVVLMMTILVQIFQSATGAMSLSRTTQELDVVLRQIDSMIRADLAGTTAKMTPPNDPTQKTGYFEYIENSPADPQGEDTDDALAFTTKAPEGQVFYGRQFLLNTNLNVQPITISSQVGEVIYFLRNGNLYRRVFLVAPDRAKSITASVPAGAGTYNTTIFGPTLNASWQGMNDISCRPGGFSLSGVVGPIPNDLGDLTNREKRAFRPRFLNDFNPTDGIPDDNNGDGIPDYYPTLYFDGTGIARQDGNGNRIGWAPNRNVNEVVLFPSMNLERVQNAATGYDVYPFPFIYPGMYSAPDNSLPASRVTNGLGWVHYQPLNNHSPVDLGDPLPVPPLQPGNGSPLNQTWWGFPTWRETMAGTRFGVAGWTDPVLFVTNLGGIQPNGLRPFPPTVAPASNSTNLLPPVYQPGTANTPFSFDGAGSATFVAAQPAANSVVPILPNPLWEDDLILTNVRSFDIKAYDANAPLYNTNVNGLFSAGYHDLGYGSASYLNGMTGSAAIQTNVPFQTVNPNGVSNEPMGFGHEGRIPPLPQDYRYHPRWQGGNGTTTFGNIGDPSNGVIRLTRVWDSWSTDYTKAPDSDYFTNGFVPGFNLSPLLPPIYPSFPAPYPSPLRGIQIQIRVADPRNERSKVLTIRHDFTDKL